MFPNRPQDDQKGTEQNEPLSQGLGSENQMIKFMRFFLFLDCGNFLCITTFLTFLTAAELIQLTGSGFETKKMPKMR